MNLFRAFIRMSNSCNAFTMQQRRDTTINH